MAQEKKLEEAKRLYQTANADQKYVLENLFPELRASEDEKIREELIRLVKKSDEQGGWPLHKWEADRMLAWLEKQKQKVNVTKFKPGDKVTNGISTYTIKSIEDDYYRCNDGIKITFTLEYRWEIVEDEQKPETKFKIGDWILYSGDHYEGVRYITKIDENGYYIERNGLPHGIIPFNHETYMKLWALQDTKPGDVLAFDDETIVIFKDLYNATTFHSYCHIEDGLFNISTDEMPNWWEGEGFHPATEEQRNILFQKMHEAGYEWDDKKKELKKIDNEEINGEDYGIDGLWHARRILEKTLGEVDGYQTDDGILDHKAAITAVKKLYGQNPIWNEEDENCLSTIIAEFSKCAGKSVSKDEWMRCNDFLNSLRDRVYPKQEWSEEDKKIITNIGEYLNRYGNCIVESNEEKAADVYKSADWIKSFKERYT